MRLILLSFVLGFSAQSFASQSSRACEHSIKGMALFAADDSAYYEADLDSGAPWYEDEPRIPGSGSDPDGSGYTGEDRGTGEDNSGDVSDTGRDSDSSP